MAQAQAAAAVQRADDIMTRTMTEGEESLTPEEFLLLAKQGIILSEKHPEYVNTRDADGKTALIYAAERGNAELMGTLLEFNNANLFIKDKTGMTALDHFEDFYDEYRHITPAEYNAYVEGFQEFEKEQAKEASGLHIVAQQRDRGNANISDDVLGKVSSMITGAEGSIPRQKEFMRAQTRGGRRRKTKKRKTNRRKTKGKKHRKSFT